jgi:hypothetical protein
MTERRYTDDEVAEIFARASETEQTSRRQQLQTVEGLTLTELQRIGGEAGIAPELVAHAARALDEPRPPAPPVFLGLPLGAARTVKLERRLSDAEWEKLVVELRETFEARGVVRSEGSLRSWSNGNLQVLLEPDGEGQRIRFRTVKGNARPFMFAGLGLVGASAAMVATALVTGSASMAQAVASFGTMALAGVGLFAAGALPLPRWARLRQQQMDALAERLTSPSP